MILAISIPAMAQGGGLSDESEFERGSLKKENRKTLIREAVKEALDECRCSGNKGNKKKVNTLASSIGIDEAGLEAGWFVAPGSKVILLKSGIGMIPNARTGAMFKRSFSLGIEGGSLTNGPLCQHE